MSAAPHSRPGSRFTGRRQWPRVVSCIGLGGLHLLLSGCGASTCNRVEALYAEALDRLEPHTEPVPLIVGVQLVLLQQVARSFLAAQASGLEQRLDDDFGAIEGFPARLDWQMAVSDVTLQGTGDELQVCASLFVSTTAAASESGIGALIRAGLAGDAQLCARLVVASDDAGASLWQMQPGSLSVQGLRLRGTGIAGLASGAFGQISSLLNNAIPHLATSITTTQPLFAWQGALLTESGPRLHPVAMTIEGQYLYLALATEPLQTDGLVWEFPVSSSPIVVQASAAAMAQLASAWLLAITAATHQEQPAYVVHDIRTDDRGLRTVLSVFDRSWPCTCVQLNVNTQVSVVDHRLVLAPDPLQLLSSSRPDLLVRGALPNHRELGNAWSEQLALWLAQHVITFKENERLVVVPLEAYLSNGRLTLGAELRNQEDIGVNTTPTSGSP